MGSRHAAAALLFVVSMGAMGATGMVDGPPAQMVERCSPVLGATVCTRVEMDGGTVVALGASVPLSLIEAVPHDVEMVWPPEPIGVIELPQEARTQLGLDHMGVNWEAHGHPPRAFLAPHFDFHFYAVGRDEVAAIDCSDTSKPPVLPSGYVLPDVEVPGMGVLVGLCVPNMGMHGMPEADAVGSDPFEASMMLGYYGGRLVFFEPMVAESLLLRRASFTLEMPEVRELPAGVRYPATFRADYDADADAYHLVFRDFSAPRASAPDPVAGRDLR